MKPKSYHDRAVARRVRIKQQIMLSDGIVLPPAWKKRTGRHRLWRRFILTGKFMSLRAKQSQKLAEIVRRKHWPQQDEKVYGYARVPVRFWNRRSSKWMDMPSR